MSEPDILADVFSVLQDQATVFAGRGRGRGPRGVRARGSRGVRARGPPVRARGPPVRARGPPVRARRPRGRVQIQARLNEKRGKRDPTPLGQQGPCHRFPGLRKNYKRNRMYSNSDDYVHFFSMVDDPTDTEVAECWIDKNGYAPFWAINPNETTATWKNKRYWPTISPFKGDAVSHLVQAFSPFSLGGGIQAIVKVSVRKYKGGPWVDNADFRRKGTIGPNQMPFLKQVISIVKMPIGFAGMLFGLEKMKMIVEKNELKTKLNASDFIAKLRTIEDHMEELANL